MKDGVRQSVTFENGTVCNSLSPESTVDNDKDDASSGRSQVFSLTVNESSASQSVPM